MKRQIKILALVAVVVLAIIATSGCATKFVSPHAMKNNEYLHAPVINKFAQNSSSQIFSTYCLINAGWATEIPPGGIGRWVALARMKSGEIAAGFMVEYERNNANHDVGRVLIDAELGQVESVLILDHAATVVANLEGREFRYDAKKFSKDKAYQAKVFTEMGTKVEDIDRFWRQYSSTTPGIRQFYDSSRFGTAVESIAVGSKEWRELEKNFSKKFPHTYRMPNGELVASRLDEKQFKTMVVQNNGMTMGQRFMKYWDVVLSPDPISMGIFNVTSALNALRKAYMEDPSGYYANARVLRSETKPQFASQKRKSDEVVRKLNEANEQLLGEVLYLRSKMNQ